MADKFLGEIRNNFQFLYNKYHAIEGEHEYDNLSGGHSVIVLRLDKVLLKFEQMKNIVTISFSRPRSRRGEVIWLPIDKTAQKMRLEASPVFNRSKATLAEKSAELEKFLDANIDKFKMVFIQVQEQ